MAVPVDSEQEDRAMKYINDLEKKKKITKYMGKHT